MDGRVLAFVAVATVLTVTPGADMALVTRNVLRAGFEAGLRTSAGILLGLMVWAVLSVAGVAAVVAASAEAFTLLKLAGAAYLVYLGLATLWQSRRRGADDASRPNDVGWGNHFRQGLVSNLTNPKVGLFYTTLLPQFVRPGDSVAAWTMVLAGIHLAMGVVWLAFYSWLVARVRETFSRGASARRWTA